ncbi:MAG: hypothetical protein CMO55_00715 [Verrucomicrobiales bacterium]|nr:hypothetical protein [Verrucomicrobiales bacterium]
MKELFISALLLFTQLSVAEQLAVEPKPFLQLQDGDRVVFLGDSITHQCLYTQYIEDFFYTRYPDRKIHFHNAGVSGDRASDALVRFEDDVAAFSPNVVTLLLGMNDGQYEPFSTETFDTYTTGMTELIEKITATGAKPIALSPTMFDHHQLALRKQDPEFRFGDRSFDENYNSLMAFYGAWLRETAGKQGIPFVNLWGPLNDLSFAARSAQPDFSVVEDSIHPGAAGQFIMAYSVLFASQPEKKTVSSIVLIKRGEKWIAGKKSGVSDLHVSDNEDEISFTFLAEALPWVVPEESSNYQLKWGKSSPASLGYDMTNAGHKLSSERLRLAGLPAGTYQLTIDETVVGEFSHTTLGSKVELQKYPNTPQSQQALQVALLNRERNDEAVRPMRDLWSRIKGIRRKGDDELFEKEYPKLKEKIDQLEAKAAGYEKQIYEAAQPKPRTYKLKRVDQ